MSNKLYLECNAGISGDMMVAALIDLGADKEKLLSVLDTVPVDGFTIKLSRVMKAGIDCQDFDVVLEEENHDHDMEYLHGKEIHPHHDHHHEHEHHHDQDHHHDHDHHHEHSHSHVHRNLTDIVSIIEGTEMTQKAKETAKKIFTIVAEAESKAHDKPIEEVHFHEVGAVDSIVDIISVAVCLDDLGIEKVIVPFLAEGKGTVRCAHGVLPIPVPAVAQIVSNYGISLQMLPYQGEFVTPTGAAIVAAICTEEQLPKRMKIQKVGMGAGKRTYELASILRAMLIEDSTVDAEDVIYKLESNIDDCSGETLGYTMERLFEAGARDVHYHPVFMKKSRPGWQINVICKESEVEALEEIIFRETTTIGIRRMKLERSILQREIREVETPYGNVLVKVCELNGEQQCYPEYESVSQLAKKHKVSYMDMYDIAKSAFKM